MMKPLAYNHILNGLRAGVANGHCDFMTYGQFGQRWGLGPYAPAWANGTVLNHVADALTRDPNIRLDLTFMLRNGDTGYPSVIDGQGSNPPGPRQMARAREVAQQIIDRYLPGMRNPY
jgi:hypothetical protein